LRKEKTNTVGKEIWGNEKRRNVKGNFKWYNCESRLCIFHQYVNESIARGEKLTRHFISRPTFLSLLKPWMPSGSC
jgi:hypothetical protein